MPINPLRQKLFKGIKRGFLSPPNNLQPVRAKPLGRNRNPVYAFISYNACRLLQLKCTGIQLIVFTALLKQLLMRAALNDPPVIHHHDHIRVTDSG